MKTTLATTLTALLFTACTGSTEPAQQITGRIDLTTFPEPVTEVRAVGIDGVVSTAVAADGSFAIAAPVGGRYRLELVSATRRADLVFPRRTGSIDTSFYIGGATSTIQLGTLRYLRDAATCGYEFDGQGCADGQTAEGDPCVDDSADEGGGGGQDEGGGGTEDGDGGGQDCGGDDADAPEGGNGGHGDSATCDHNPPAEVCGGGQDTGTGGGQDTGTRGGQDTGGGSQDPGTPGEE
jgi:hypothetical protein